MKYTSQFVKRMRALKERIKSRLLWNSAKIGTYIKADHGEI